MFLGYVCRPKAQRRAPTWHRGGRSWLCASSGPLEARTNGVSSSTTRQWIPCRLRMELQRPLWSASGPTGVVLVCSHTAPIINLIWCLTDIMFDNILKPRNWSAVQARSAAMQGGLCLAEDCSILEHMTQHPEHLQDGSMMVVCQPVTVHTAQCT